MTRRVTIPDDHVALILPNQLSDELMAILKEFRRNRRKFREPDSMVAVSGDVMLALLEAKEA